jgi:hypothetical protein
VREIYIGYATDDSRQEQKAEQAVPLSEIKNAIVINVFVIENNAGEKSQHGCLRRRLKVAIP